MLQLSYSELAQCLHFFHIIVERTLNPYFVDKNLGTFHSHSLCALTPMDEIIPIQEPILVRESAKWHCLRGLRTSCSSSLSVRVWRRQLTTVATRQFSNYESN